MNHDKIERYKNAYPAGSRVKLNYMADEPGMPKGLEGTVWLVDDIGSIHVEWDNSRSISLIPGVDSFQPINYEQGQEPVDMTL